MSEERLRALARVLRGERAVEAATRRALQHLLDYGARALSSSGYDAAVLSAAASGWRNSTQLAALLGEVEGVFLAGWSATERKVIDPTPYANRHLEAVSSRLVGVPDAVFDNMRTELAAGRSAGEGIAALATRLDGLLSDEQRWTGRARTIARTEVIGANNAGAMGSAAATAELLGEDPGSVVKEWLATGDSRTRDSHAEANGQQVKGLDTPFVVGGSSLDQPADPYGDPAETINCRCTVLFHYPGDPSYPDELQATAAPAPAAQARAVQYPGELPVDAGPQSLTERDARTMTPEALMAETSTSGGIPKSAARAELQRRGLTAALPSDADGGHTGVLVVALPAADDPVHGIGPETKHASLLYYGDAETVVQEADGVTGYGPDFRSVLESTVAGYAGTVAPFTETVTGVESLGENGARVWMIDRDGSRLAFINGDLPDYDSEVTPPPSDYPEFTPHVTIGYPDPALAEEADGTSLVPELEDAAAAVTSIRFDRLAVWWAGEETVYQLTGSEPPQEAAPMDTDTPSEQVTAAHTAAQERSRQIAARISADPEAMADPVWSRLVQLMTEPLTMAPGDEPDAEVVELPTPEATGTEVGDMPDDGEPFYGILWPEDTISGDSRMIAAQATTWRDLPLPVHYQDAIALGHDGAVRVGRIDTLTRDETTYPVPVIRYTGVWDTSETAVEARRQVDAQMVRGISVDGVSVTIELRDSQGQPLDPMLDDFPEDGVVVEAATAAAIAGGTICSVPAFHQAYIANGSLEQRTDPEPGWNDAPVTPAEAPNAGGMDLEPVAASAAPTRPAWSLTAAAGPVLSSSDFANPGLTEPTRLTVTDDGRVYGHLATWGMCHIGIDGVCQEPPYSATNCAYFNTGSVPTEAGYAAVGQLTMETGHASMRANHRAAVAHYDNTGTAVADVAMGQDDVGYWFAGRLRPGTTPEQVFALRAAGSVSGDWRDVGGHLELVAALVCNVPGFPIPVPSVAASGARPVAMVASGVVRPTPSAAAAAPALEPGERDLARAVFAQVQRMGRAQAAAARLRSTRAASARRKLQASATAERRTRQAAAAARLTR